MDKRKTRELGKKFTGYVAMNVLGMMGLSCYILADTYFISERLGADGLTSLNLAISVYSVISGLGLMLGIGGATRYAVARAAGTENGKRIFTGAAAWGLLSGVVLALWGILGADGLAGILGAEGEIRGMTGTYLRTVMAFSPCFILNHILTAFVRNDGNPGVSMGAMLCGSFSNILLDYLFMYPLRLGIFGAALATGIAPLISVGWMLLTFQRRKPGFGIGRYRTGFRELADMFRLGAAAFLNEISSGVVLVTFNLVILGLDGNVGVAAYGIVANLALVVIAVFNGIAQGSQPLISAACGEGDKETVDRLGRWTAAAALGCGIVAVLFFYWKTEPLVGVFNSEGNRELAETAFEAIRWYAPGFLMAGINVVSAAGFSAVERAGESFLIAVFRGCVGILAAVGILPCFLGLTGVWLAFPAAETLTLAITAVLFIRGKRGRHGLKCV